MGPSAGNRRSSAERRRSPRSPSERRRDLEARDQLLRVAVEVGARGGGDRLAPDELLAERVHEGTVACDAVVEVGPRREPGGADVADDLFLPHAQAGPQAGGDPRKMV